MHTSLIVLALSSLLASSYASITPACSIPDSRMFDIMKIGSQQVLLDQAATVCEKAHDIANGNCQNGCESGATSDEESGSAMVTAKAKSLRDHWFPNCGVCPAFSLYVSLPLVLLIDWSDICAP